MNLEKLTSGILNKEIRAVARSISIVENRQDISTKLLQSIFPYTGKALTVGITGSPGAGKSSLVDKLALHYRQELDNHVGIMQTLGLDPKVFIRSMATRGNLGGLAAATVDAVTILDAAGYDKIIVETVGVGQDEIDIVKTADVSIVVLVPGMGDDVQAIKAGLMEIADIFVINKADREGVHRTEIELEALLSINERSDGWIVPIVKTIATQSKGIEDLSNAISKYSKFQKESSSQNLTRRHRIAEQRLIEILQAKLLSKAISKALKEGELNQFAEAVATRHRDPYSIVEEICTRLNL